ncbi:MAG: ATP-dependent Clp protease ATP-binding subunit [Anaerolineae bacterium]|nr:ATP-dependent Clp protease ATP-binding subunit [Anaerolineae bacterium]
MTPSPDIPEREIRERCAPLLRGAGEEAHKMGHNYMGVEHLFMATTRNESGPICKLLIRAGLDPHEVRRAIRREVGGGEDRLQEVLPLTPRAAMILSLAIFLAEREEEDEINENHFMMALLQEGESVPVRILMDLGFDINLWLQRLIMEESDEGFPEMVEPKVGFAFEDLDRALERDVRRLDNDLISDSDHHLPTPLLDKYGRDLTQQAREGHIQPAISREREIRSLARTLARSKKNNPLLLGDAGVGKTAVVEGLAYAIAHDSAPPSLLNRRVVQIEIGTLVAGTSLRGQFEERLIGIVDEVKRAANVILFIDEIHTIVGAGDTIDSNLDAANILKPALARGELVCIGATTHEEYRRAIAQDPALTRRFRTIDIEEPSEQDTLAILAGQKDRLQDHHGVQIRSEALEAAVRLSVRYLPDRRLPDKALDLLDEACTRVIIRSVSPDDEEDTNLDNEAVVNVETIADVLSEWTGIPVNDLTKDERQRLARLEDQLLKRVIGQDEAVKAVASAIKTARAGLGDPNRPVGVFLFLGPSGVGKTELARTLAENLFGDEDSLLRLDMSEFHDSHTVARLIGAPPGYRDTQRGGQLTDALRRRPYSVVLLDEVEKAAPEVFDIFLQVFDEGRLSDARGGVVDARHSVFIMTSNIGTEESAKAVGFTATQHRKDSFTAELHRFFRPEFLNRLDEVLIFNPLAEDTLSKILDIEMHELHDRLAHQKYELVLTDEARAYVLSKGADPDNGARHLRRAIERYVTRPLSARIVEDSFEPGDTIYAYATDDDGLRFEAGTEQST